MIQMLRTQKSAKVIALGMLKPRIDAPPPTDAKPGHSATRKVWIASPPIEHWMPNQPHATIARSTAGMFAPHVPNDDRASTGKGMP